MATAIEVQQFAEARAGLAPPPMPAAGAGPPDEAGLLERGLHEGVGKRHPVIPLGELVEVADVEARVALPIQAQDALELRDGHPSGRRGLPAPIEQAFDPIALKLPPPAPHGPGAQPQDVGDLKPGLAAMQGVQDGLVNRHGTLHGRHGIAHRHLLGGGSFPWGLQERSCHLFSGAVTSCAPNTDGSSPVDVVMCVGVASRHPEVATLVSSG